MGGGYGQSLALKGDGTVWAWGSNYYGQLGDGTFGSRLSPVQVRGPLGQGFLSDVTAIAAGNAHNLALKSNGTVWNWGRNFDGKLGSGTTIDRTTPIQVSGLIEASAIAGGNAHSLAAATMSTAPNPTPTSPLPNADGARARSGPFTFTFDLTQQMTYDIVFENTGAVPWTRDAGYGMRNVDSGEEYSLGSLFGLGGCDGTPPAQGVWCRWTIAVTVPSSIPGTYELHYRMYHGDAGFGDTITVTITVLGRLEAVVSGITRNPDTSFTGLWTDTVELRVRNVGPMRTTAQVHWYYTSSNDLAALAKFDRFDLDPGGVQTLGRDFVPDGCSRCQAIVSSLDRDGTGPIYGTSDLEATIVQRVVPAGNVTASINVPAVEEVLPAGPHAANTWVLPVVYKHHQLGPDDWDSLVTGCVLASAPVSQVLRFELTPIGTGSTGGPYVITRSVKPGGCTTVNLPTVSLPNGSYSMTVTSTGGSFGSVLSYTITGHGAQLTYGRAGAPGPVGGHDFTLRLGGSPPQTTGVRTAATRSRELSWMPGAQTSTLVLRWSPEHGFSSLAILPRLAASFTDSEALTDPVYCYALISYLGELSTPDVRSISDLLCIAPNLASGQGPTQFQVRLDETSEVKLDWAAPGPQDRYVLAARRFDSTSSQNIPLPGNRTSFSADLAGHATCYRLLAYGGPTELGGTDELCAVPGVGVFLAGATEPREAAERVQQPVPRSR